MNRSHPTLVAALLTLAACSAGALTRTAQGPAAPDVGGTVTVTPGGTRETPSVTPLPPPGPVVEPAAPTVTTEPSPPSQVSPPKVMEPTMPETATQPARPSAPAGVGAGPRAEVTPRAEAQPVSTARTSELIPRAGVDIGWLAVAGGVLTGIGLAMRRRRR